MYAPTQDVHISHNKLLEHLKYMGKTGMNHRSPVDAQDTHDLFHPSGGKIWCKI